MAFHKNLQNKYVRTTYENEGFLYINTQNNETFKKGEITDANGNIICPGIIVPTLPIKESNREIGDEQFVSIDSCKAQFKQYYPLKQWKNLRIYWVEIHEVFVVSTDMRIYIMHDEMYDMSSVNFDLLDKTKCYYCITDTEKGMILTNIVDKDAPCLETSYDIDEDLAFANHIDWIDITCDELLECAAQQENGILCVLQDGRQLEIRNLQYNYHCSLAKPDNISIYIYYIMCLNKYAEGGNYVEYFDSLHDYVREFTDAYPEYTRQCNILSNKLRNYINTFEFEEISDLNDNIQGLLSKEPEELLQLLMKY